VQIYFVVDACRLLLAVLVLRVLCFMANKMNMMMNNTA